MNDYASSSNTDSSESHRAPRPSSMDVPSPSSAWALRPSSADVPHPEEIQWRERWFHAFDTECFVKARASEHNLDQVVSLCARYERLLSHTLPGSDIWAVNHAEGRRTKVDPETAALVREALHRHRPRGRDNAWGHREGLHRRPCARFTGWPGRARRVHKPWRKRCGHGTIPSRQAVEHRGEVARLPSRPGEKANRERGHRAIAARDRQARASRFGEKAREACMRSHLLRSVRSDERNL